MCQNEYLWSKGLGLWYVLSRQGGKDFEYIIGNGENVSDLHFSPFGTIFFPLKGNFCHLGYIHSNLSAENWKSCLFNPSKASPGFYVSAVKAF